MFGVPSRLRLVIFFTTLSPFWGCAGKSPQLDPQHSYTEWLVAESNHRDIGHAEELCTSLISMWGNHLSNVEYMKSKCSGRLPFVTLTFAQSLDGMIACKTNTTLSEEGPITSSNLKISCDESLIMTHALRSIHDAVLIGGKTLWVDNPRLNNRLFHPTVHPYKMKQPMGVVLDTNLTYIRKYLRGGKANDTEPPLLRANNLIVCCSTRAARIFRTLPKQLSYGNDKKISLLGCRTNIDGTLDLVDLLLSLKSTFGINSVMVEGGAHILSSFLSISCQQKQRIADTTATRIVDMIVVTISPKILGAVCGLGTFSKFNIFNIQNGTLPSLDFQSPTAFFRKIGSDMVIASPLRL